MTKRTIFLSVIFIMTEMAVMAQTSRLQSKNFTTRDGLASNVVNCGLQDRKGYIWLGTNHGLTRFDGHRFANFYVEENGQRQIEGITHIVEDTAKHVLLMSGKDYRLLCFSLDNMCFTSAEGMQYPNEDDEDKDYQAYADRARELGIDRGNKTNRRHDLHHAVLNDGRELFATIDNGFFIYEPKSRQLQHYRATDEQPVIESDYINGILKDRSGGVWLLTTFAGICRLESDEEDILYHALSPNIRSFAQIDDTQIAVGDMEGRVFCYQPDTRQSNIIFNKGFRAYAINIDSKGRLWIGTRGGGVWIIEEFNNLKIKKLEDLPARQIYDIKFSKGGTVWIASLDGGLIEAHEQPDGTFFFFKDLTQERVHEVDIDLKGCVWAATENGILKKGGMRTDTVYNMGKVVCICHDNNGIIWAGSNGHGLIKIDNGKMSFIQADDGLANNCVESVACDNQGNVIVGTDQGVSILNSKDGSVRNLYSPQGLRADTYNENAILRTRQGRIFLGSLTGLVELSPTATGSDSTATAGNRPLLTCIDVNDMPKYDHLDGEIHLSHDQNNLCFHFSSFAYHDLSTLIYSYWLEGFDQDWRPSTKESCALYTNLTPDHYRLHVRSRLAGTNWSEETVCDVYIAQPWYWTWWARILYLLIFLLFVFYELHQYQQRLSLRRQLDQRLAALYAVEAHQAEASEPSEVSKVPVIPEAIEGAGAPAAPKTPETVVPQKNKDFLDKLDRLILENLLQTDLDVNFIAQEMCMSYSTLHRRIKSTTGMTANEYVRKHRLAKAMQLLHEGHNATEVSMQCGFNSPSYFTRCFKAEYGILPSEVGD